MTSTRPRPRPSRRDSGFTLIERIQLGSGLQAELGAGATREDLHAAHGISRQKLAGLLAEAWGAARDDGALPMAA